LPPVQQGREFHSLDTAGNSKAQKQSVEVGFHGPPRHFELAGDFGVVAPLQEQFDDLLLARTQSNGLLLHQAPLQKHSFPSPQVSNIWLNVCKIVSTQNATSRLPVA